MTGTEPVDPARGPGGRGQPLFAVVKGEPTPEELAALTAVVLSLGSGEPDAPAEAERPALDPPAAAAAGTEAGSRFVEAQPRLSVRAPEPPGPGKSAATLS